MNRSWILIIIFAIVLLAAYIGYGFYLSVSGQNLEFNKTVEVSVTDDLGVNELEYLDTIKPNVLIESAILGEPEGEDVD